MTNCSNDKQRGSWLNIYDQMLVVTLENGMRFSANFKYTLRGNITKNVEPHMIEGKLKDKVHPEMTALNFYKSVCNQTMIGFIQDTSKPHGSLEEHPIQCFWAEKDKRQIYEDQVGADLKQDKLDVHFVQIDQKSKYDSGADDFVAKDVQAPISMVTHTKMSDEDLIK